MNFLLNRFSINFRPEECHLCYSPEILTIIHIFIKEAYIMNFTHDRHQRALSLILELGYLCAFSSSTREQAVALLTAHKAARPDSRGHLVGEALICLCCDGKPDEAVSAIRQAGFDYRNAPKSH